MGTIASIVGRICTFWFPEMVQDMMCGVCGAVGTVIGGLVIAPIKHPTVKWVMIPICWIMGLIEIIGGLASQDDQVKGITIGGAVIITSICYCAIPTHELAKDI